MGGLTRDYWVPPQFLGDKKWKYVRDGKFIEEKKPNYVLRTVNILLLIGFIIGIAKIRGW